MSIGSLNDDLRTLKFPWWVLARWPGQATRVYGTYRLRRHARNIAKQVRGSFDAHVVVRRVTIIGAVPPR